MLVQVRTDNHIANSDELTASVRAEVESALNSQFADQLRRVEVYIQDVNGHKNGIDTRCSIEARLAGLQPVVVHEIAPSVEAAVSAAVEKMVRALQGKKGRLADRHGQISMSGDEASR